MDFMILSVIIFILSLVVIELILYAYRNARATQKAKIKKRLRKYTFLEDDFGDIIKKRYLSDVPTLDRIMKSIPPIVKMDRMILQANVSQPLSIYLLLSFLFSAVSFMGSYLYWNSILYSIGFGIIGTLYPFLYLHNKKEKRIEKFQNQFHEALDLVARALRAGHSFNSALKLASEEFEDPVGTEFAETLDEINFGVSVPNALRNMLERIDSKEVKYFVIAVIIQRETGGNLAELITSLAHLVRERIKFEGKVRILSAEGKMSAVILILIPFFVAGWLQLSNPDFLVPLFEEPVGKMMLSIASVLMIVGSLVMKKMVKIDV